MKLNWKREIPLLQEQLVNYRKQNSNALQDKGVAAELSQNQSPDTSLQTLLVKDIEARHLMLIPTIALI